MMPSLTFQPVTTPEQILSVELLAREIWYEYYVPLIGKAQVDYMVAKFQSAAAMQEQIDSGYLYFLLQQEGAALGYFAAQPQPASQRLFVSKLYLHRNARGRGTGRAAMEFIEKLALERGLAHLWLTVNKGNPAVGAYQKMGLQIVESIVMDIGGGFVMDDFRMEKAITRRCNEAGNDPV